MELKKFYVAELFVVVEVGEEQHTMEAKDHQKLYAKHFLQHKHM